MLQRPAYSYTTYALCGVQPITVELLGSKYVLCLYYVVAGCNPPPTCSCPELQLAVAVTDMPAVVPAESVFWSVASMGWVVQKPAASSKLATLLASHDVTATQFCRGSA